MVLPRIFGLALLALVTGAAIPARAGPPASRPAPAKARVPPPAPSRIPLTCGVTPAEQSPVHAPLSGPRRALAVGAAVVPGVLLHGAGHFAAGDTRTGLRLFAIGGAGAGIATASVVGLAASGASRRFIIPLVLGSITGAGLFMLSAVADLYGIIAPEGGTGCPPRSLPLVETQVGVRYVYDPTFPYRAFITQGIDLRFRSFRLGATGAFALDDTNARMRGIFGYRFFGPKQGKQSDAKDGSYLEIETAVTRHRYDTYGFALTTGEISIGGRLDLARLSQSLQGSFAEMAWGMALEVYSYDGVDIGTLDATELVLGRIAFGLYLGHHGYPRGEAMLYYDHRHDDYAGGLKMRGLGSGIAGHIGAQGKLYLGPQWGVLLDAQVGSAYLAGISFLLKHGGNP